MSASTRPKNLAAGVYPGAGISVGGQIGKLGNTVAGGVKPGGGVTVGASARRPPVATPAVPSVRHPVAAPVANGRLSGGVVGLGGVRPITAGGTVAAPVATVVPANAAAPTAPDFSLFQDPNYYEDLNTIHASYDPQVATINQHVAQLQANGMGLYNTMLGNAQNAFGLQSLQARENASGHMGYHNGIQGLQQQADQSAYDQSINGPSGLYNTYGQGAVDQANQQLSSLNSAYQTQLRNAQLAASGRGLQQWQQGQDALYNTSAQGIAADPQYAQLTGSGV